MQWRVQTFHLGGGGGGGVAHVMRFNAKVTIGSFEGQKLIYNKIISRKI